MVFNVPLLHTRTWQQQKRPLQRSVITAEGRKVLRSSSNFMQAFVQWQSAHPSGISQLEARLVHGEVQLGADKEQDVSASSQICSLATKSPEQEAVYRAGKTQDDRVKHRKGTRGKMLQIDQMPAMICTNLWEDRLRITLRRKQGQTSTLCGTRHLLSLGNHNAGDPGTPRLAQLQGLKQHQTHLVTQSCQIWRWFFSHCSDLCSWYKGKDILHWSCCVCPELVPKGIIRGFHRLWRDKRGCRCRTTIP